MAGSKMQAVLLQLPLIENERERLNTYLDKIIERTKRLSANPAAARSLKRENAELLCQLTEWADLLEDHIASHQSPSPADPPPGPTSVAPSQSRTARSTTDLNATLESAVSFHTAAAGGGSVGPGGGSMGPGGGSMGLGGGSAGLGGGSVRPQSPVSRGSTTERPQRTPDPHSDCTRTATLETPSPPPPHKTCPSKISNSEVSSIINRHLLKKTFGHESPKEVVQRPPPLGVETRVVFSFHDEDTGYTYLNLWEDTDSLTKLAGDLTELALHPARMSRLPKQGELVIAAWKGAWYRARVTDVFDKGDMNSMVALQYIDYGNSEHQPVGQLRFLPDKMKEAPAAAYKCKLVNLKVGGESHWPLQRRLLLALADGPECRLRAVLRRSQLPDLYEATLISGVTVGSEPMQVDVVATLNAALLINPAAAATQIESEELQLRPLLVPYRRPAELSPPVSVKPEQPPEEKVLSWLAGQTASGARADRPTPTSRPATARANRDTAELNISFASSESRPSRRHRVRAPPEYSGLQLVWTARPIEQQLVGDGPHNVIVMQFNNPADFYLGVRSEQFDEFEERLFSVYSRLPLHPEQAVRDALLPGSYWVARWERPGEKTRWCRCVVLEEHNQKGGKEPASASYPVLWVDYGDTDRLPAVRFRPMTEEFAAEPVFAVHARCAGVYPVDELGAQLDSYSAEAATTFRELLQGTVCLAVPVPSESTTGCQAVLLEAIIDGSDDLMSVTQALLELGVAAMRDPELDPSFAEIEEQLANGHTATVPSATASQEIAKWDPMGEDFTSPFNRPEEDGEAEVAGLTGRRDPDDPGVCPVYASGRRCWDGIACPKRHVRGGDQEPVTVLIHSANPEPVVVPRIGSTVYVKVSAVLSPDKFYVQLPFGAIPAQEVNSDHAGYRRRLDMDETLESLSAAMAAAYRSCGRRHYNAACRPAIGEVLVAPFQSGWQRAMVVDLADEPETDRLSVEVFLVDHGVTMACDASELREMKQEFNLLPYQAVSCWLSCVAPASGSHWSPKAISRFVNLVSRPCLLGAVTGRRPDGQLELDLYDEHRHLSEILVRERLAVRVQRAPQPVGRKLLPV
ncbi:uncharacterized protein LOC122374147 [Amphibalanus amphitrite]|uniref:uncharacterized protein LOC122374147 n=1 Tax=Amphibalanus amphitrite TaxID=1232801 RepID=UPI001C90E8D0|nr:uncharacterized protein LOC122374147 [Amphibalanus amphitrite]